MEQSSVFTLAALVVVIATIAIHFAGLIAVVVQSWSKARQNSHNTCIGRNASFKVSSSKCNLCYSTVAVALFLIVLGQAKATDYYVSTTGSNSHSGLSMSSAWATVAYAAQFVTAGATVHVAAGTYTDPVIVGHSGTASSYITFEPVSGQTVILTSTAQSTVTISDQSYITISGFDITNTSPDDLGGEGAPGGTGVLIEDGSKYVSVIGNYVYNCGAGGIAAVPNGPDGTSLECDYLFIGYNYVANCAHTSGWHDSGISLYKVGDTSSVGTSYHNYVEYNFVYLNSEEDDLPASTEYAGYGGPHTDGNGIIIDTCGSSEPTYVAFNVCYDNGGRGVYAFQSSDCAFVNNTCYDNSQDTTLANPGGLQTCGELVVGAGNNNTFQNNIAYAHGGYDACNNVWTYSNLTATGNTFSNNCYYSGSATYGSGDEYDNPLFMNPGANDFLIAVGSAAAGDGAFPTPVLPTSFIVSAPTTSTAGSPLGVTVTAYDQTGNVAMAYGGTIHFTSSDSHAVLPANSTLTNGTGTFSATLNTSGSQQITATDTTSSSVNGSSTTNVTTLNGTYELTPSNSTGSRLDAYQAGTTNGTNVDIWSNNGTGAQKWVFTNEGGNIYKIQPSYDLSLCLDVVGSGSSGTNCDLYADDGTNAQRWAVTQNSDGTYTIVPQCAPTCALDVQYSGTSNGTQVDIYTANGTTAQKWSL